MCKIDPVTYLCNPSKNLVTEFWFKFGKFYILTGLRTKKTMRAIFNTLRDKYFKM